MSTTAIIVTTYKRPSALARSLPQIVALHVPVLVVDDGSPADVARENYNLCATHNALHLYLPQNRGLAGALGVGLSWWLADVKLEWISYFQDDVDVRPDLLEVLARIQDAVRRPLVTGHDAAEHPGRSCTTGGVYCKLKGNCRATHLHAHREYWAGVMPIRSTGLHTPCAPEELPVFERDRLARAGEQRGRGSEVDHWITHRAPRSVVKRGGYVVCVPGLVRTFLWKATESCWANAAPYGPDPELPCQS